MGWIGVKSRFSKSSLGEPTSIFRARENVNEQLGPGALFTEVIALLKNIHKNTKEGSLGTFEDAQAHARNIFSDILIKM